MLTIKGGAYRVEVRIGCYLVVVERSVGGGVEVVIRDPAEGPEDTEQKVINLDTGDDITSNMVVTRSNMRFETSQDSFSSIPMVKRPRGVKRLAMVT